MVLLERSSQPRGFVRVLPFAAGALLAACVWMGRGGAERGLVFSHRIHVSEEQLDCLNCHENVSMQSDPGMPSYDTCDLCHFEMDEEKPEERRVETLFDEAGEFRAVHASLLDDELIFDHFVHVEAVEDCDACHRGIERADRIDDAIVVDMEECRTCHAQRSVANDCDTCHSVINSDWAPPSHGRNWTERHGPVCRRTNPELVDQCSLCHEEQSCESCHMAFPPENHNAQFRLRGHAILARLDRDNCSTCHEQDSCLQCHNEVLPRSHTGMWGDAAQPALPFLSFSAG